MASFNAVVLAELARLKRGARATWAAGDVAAMAARTHPGVAARLVEAAGVRRGDAVLDVGCGTGNVALAAAGAGARVTGVDLTPELFDIARRLAADAGVRVDWVHGDAEDLPFDGARFDVVLSAFGCMFAPRHAAVAGELVRVLRPGGRLGLACWTPGGAMGSIFGTVGAYLADPSALSESPLLWGCEPHVRELLGGVDLELAREVAGAEPFASPRTAAAFHVAHFGPLVMARQLAEASGRWPDLQAELIDVFARDEPMEYLLVLGRTQRGMPSSSR